MQKWESSTGAKEPRRAVAQSAGWELQPITRSLGKLKGWKMLEA
jgi:hypothetical protein